MKTKKWTFKFPFRFGIGTLLGVMTCWIPSIGFVNSVDLGTTFFMDMTFAKIIHTISTNIAQRFGMSEFTRQVFLVAAIRQFVGAIVISVVIFVMLRLHSRVLPAIAISIIVAIPSWNFVAIGGTLPRPLTPSLVSAYCQATVVPAIISLCLLGQFIYATSCSIGCQHDRRNTDAFNSMGKAECVAIGVYVLLCVIGWKELFEFRKRWSP